MARPDGIKVGSTYEIRFQGTLEGGWSAWFNGSLHTTVVCNGDSQATCLTVHVPDQAALRGVVNRLWDLNLVLTSVRMIPALPDKETNHGR
jgi:hypothetical protein